MKLVFLPANQRWCFIFGALTGDHSIETVDGWRFFATRRFAVETARKLGLAVDKRGNVATIGA